LLAPLIAHKMLQHLLSNHHCCWKQKKNLWQSYEHF